MFSKIMEKLKIPKGFYKTDSNVVSQQIPSFSDWRQDLICLRKNLKKNDILPVLKACSARGVKPYDMIVDNPDSAGVGLRMDLSRGYNRC